MADHGTPPAFDSDDDSAEDGATDIIGTVLNADRLDRAIVEALSETPLSRARVQALIAEGRVLVAGRVAANPSAKVTAGTPFAIALPAPTALAARPQDIPLPIVYEDDDLLIVDKPAGMVVHPAAGNADGTLVNALLHHCAGRLSGIGGVARPGIVHRIDKDTSGLLVVAKTDRAHEGLARQFADHSIERVYQAITTGAPIPAAGTIRGTIARDPRDRKRMALIEGADAARRGKHAVTHYRVIEPLGGTGRAAAAALVECRLETGRTHQVRVHMASIGHGLLGDPLYGRSQKSLKPRLERLGFARQALHAAVLGFIHPLSGERLHFASPLPVDMRDLLGDLRGDVEPPGHSRALPGMAE